MIMIINNYIAISFQERLSFWKPWACRASANFLRLTNQKSWFWIFWPRESLHNQHQPSSIIISNSFCYLITPYLFTNNPASSINEAEWNFYFRYDQYWIIYSICTYLNIQIQKYTRTLINTYGCSLITSSRRPHANSIALAYQFVPMGHFCRPIRGPRG